VKCDICGLERKAEEIEQVDCGILGFGASDTTLVCHDCLNRHGRYEICFIKYG